MVQAIQHVFAKVLVQNMDTKNILHKMCREDLVKKMCIKVIAKVFLKSMLMDDWFAVGEDEFFIFSVLHARSV